MTDSQNNDLVLTLDDFTSCGWETAWEAALESGKKNNYDSMQMAFTAAADRAFEEGRENHGEALKRLVQVCFLKFDLSTKSNRPFKPGRVLDNFSESDLEFFAQIVEAEATDNPRLNGRLADIVWVMKPSAKHTFALAAIDSYRKIPLDVENWFRNGRDCWRRAVKLSHMFKKGDKNPHVEIKESLFQALKSAKTEDNSFAYFLAELLLLCQLENGQATMAGETIARLGKEFETVPEYRLAIRNFEMANNLFKKDKNEAKIVEMAVAIAEGWVKEAEAKISLDKSHTVAAICYASAIEVYREIPQSERAKHGVNERIKEIETLRNRSKEKFSDEMQTFSAEVDTTDDDTQYFRNAVSGKSRDEAMKAFTDLHRINVDRRRNSAVEIIKEYSFLQLVSRSYLSSDGRLEARRPAVDRDNISPAVIEELMLFGYYTDIGDFALSGIRPALEILHLEHQFDEAYFLELARQSPIVPTDRKRLYGKALAAGFNSDFEVAIHLLAPLIENIVRRLLKANGVKTTFTARNGVETENGLSSLMETEESIPILGNNLHFEIHALFCSPIGSNLRNKVAHGLLNDETSRSPSCIYAWWRALRLMFANLSKVQAGTLLKDTDDSNLRDEADAGDSVDHEAE